MSKVKNNIVTQGLSGKLGNMLVFRQRGDQTIVATKPAESNKEFTAAQKAHHTKFQKAIIYGKAAIADASIRGEYEKGANENQSAYNIAVADYMNAPKIENIDISGYSGNINELIFVTVVDDFKVEEVKVSIKNADGTMVESGFALATVNPSIWSYVTKQVNSSTLGDQIIIEASDIPGNISRDTRTL